MQPFYQGVPSTQAGPLIEWLDDKNFSLTSEVDIPTHNRGNILDLCFGSHSLMAKGITASTHQHLDITSEYLPLFITVLFDNQRAYAEPKLRIASIDENIYHSLFKINITGIKSHEQISPSGTDKRAEEIVDALQNSFAGSAKRILPHNIGKS